MFSAFFGNYLLNEGVVTAQQLSHIFDKQDSVRLKLGVLAINDGFMTSAQVEEVHQQQSAMDKRFGEIALEKGYLKEEQLVYLLKQQESEHLLLAQALIDQGIMNMERLEHHFHAYKKKHDISDEQFEALQSGDVALAVNAFLAFETDDQSMYADYLTLLMKNMIRFIDQHVSLDRVRKVSGVTMTHVFRQRLIVGEDKYLTAISADESVFLQFAGAFVDETITEMGEYAIDAIGEFLNLHNGLFLVNCSNKGMEMDMTVQAYFEHMSIRSQHNLYVIPIYTSFGTIKVVIGKV